MSWLGDEHSNASRESDALTTRLPSRHCVIVSLITVTSSHDTCDSCLLGDSCTSIISAHNRLFVDLLRLLSTHESQNVFGHLVRVNEWSLKQESEEWVTVLKGPCFSLELESRSLPQMGELLFWQLKFWLYNILHFSACHEWTEIWIIW